jgi:hypothetical protein
LLLGGCCGGLCKNPFAIDAESIDERAPQTAARIRLSPPQVFTREQLINDRLREDGFLTGQLSKSESATLGTSLARDLQTISALSAQLSVSVDPAAKLNFQKQSQQADLQQQIDVVQLQGQLLTLQNQLKALQAGTGTGPAAPATTPSTTVTSETNTTASDTRITALQSRVDSALAALASLGATTRQNAVTGTLEDEFEDRLALRARIREAINANALDDAHDLDGNALYHLQFTATLLPGEHKSQFGIAKIKIEPPTLKQEDIDLLYYAWLASVTNRMNQSIGHREEGKEALSYEMLGPITGLYDVAHMKLPRTKDTNQKEYEFLLAVRPGHRFGVEYSGDDQHKDLKAVIKYFKYLDSKQELDRCFKQILTISTNRQADKLPVPDGTMKFSNLTSDCPYQYESSTVADMNVGDLIEFIRAVILISPSVEATVFAIGDRSLIPEDIKKLIQSELATYTDSYSYARWILKHFSQTCLQADNLDIKTSPGCQIYDPSDIQMFSRTDRSTSNASGSLQKNLPPLPGTLHAPPEFCRALFIDANHHAGNCPSDDLRNGIKAVGLAYPYSADPVRRSQRVSTVASAANALDLAAAVAAQVPQFGAGVGGGLGYSRRAAGRVDTIERVPQVFGFAGPIFNQTKCEDQAYEFGWVFGPKLSLDPSGNQLLLRQDARTQQVSADISVPAWWPRATLQVQTAWKGAFAGGGRILDKALTEERKDATEKSDRGPDSYDSYDLPIRFKLNTAALDALTVKLARILTAQGFHQARIDAVRPEVIPVCADAANKSLTILIYGIDLWRNPKVFFGGQMVQSNSIAVLPDMTGISATIDTSLLSKAALDKDKTLVVWTAHGVAETKLETKISTNCESNAGESLSKTHTASILRISPTQISACDASVDISVTGDNLSATADNYYLGTIRASKIVSDDRIVKSAKEEDDEKRPHTVTLTFDNLQQGNNKGLTSFVLTMIKPEGLASATVDVGGGSCANAKSPAKPDAPFQFSSAITTIAPASDYSGTLRVLLTFPAGKASSIDISATGGEITKVAFADSTPPANVSLQTAGGVVTIGTSTAPSKGAKPNAIDLTFRNLVKGETLKLTASARPTDGAKIDPVSVSIAINPALQPEKAAATTK